MSVEENRSWMYNGWHENGRHSEECVRNTNNFIDRAFEGVPCTNKSGVVCPCSSCRNRVRRRKDRMAIDLCKWGFMPGYTRWTQHGEQCEHIPVSSLVNSSDTSELGKHQHQDEEEHERHRLFEDARLTKAYVQSLSQWSKDCYRHSIALHKYMVDIAAYLKMPATDVPPLPPPPLIYPDSVAESAEQSPLHAQSCESGVGAD